MNKEITLSQKQFDLDASLVAVLMRLLQEMERG